MQQTVTSPTKLILIANAVILAVATLLQAHATPGKDIVMSLLFLTWVGLFIWHMTSAHMARTS